eukprot:g22199.t2
MVSGDDRLVVLLGPWIRHVVIIGSAPAQATTDRTSADLPRCAFVSFSILWMAFIALGICMQDLKYRTQVKRINQEQQRLFAQEPEADENLAAPSKDIYIEAKELQRAHRVLTASDSESKPFGGFWHTPSPCRKRAMCPVCGASTTPRGSDGTLDEPSTEKDLGIQVEILEDLLAQSRPVASEAKRLQHQLASTEARLADTQAALDLAMGLCQELHSAMELQTADFQRFVEDLRRACGDRTASAGDRRVGGAWMEQRQQLEVELDTMVKLCLPGNKQIADLHEDGECLMSPESVGRAEQAQEVITPQSRPCRHNFKTPRHRVGTPHVKPCWSCKNVCTGASAKNAQLEAQKAHAEDQVLTLQADLEQAQQGVAEAKREDGIYGAFGIHPLRADEWDSEVEQKLVRMMSMDKVVAWGECGLDYFDKMTRGQVKDERTRGLQREVFARQINLAVSLNKPLVVHTRFAEEDTLELLEKHLPDSHPVHVHCFTSSNTLAQSLLQRFSSLRLGFTGGVTFANAPEVRDVVQQVPLDRILLETDSPYMAPEPFRGRIAHPGHVSYVADAIAQVKSSRAATRAKRAQEVPQGLVVRSLDMLSKGEVVWKLCAANGKWQERFMAVTPGPPAAPESLKWSKDAGRRKLRRPSSVGLQEALPVALPARHKAQVTKPWCCFSVWTAQRSFHFKAESELIAENFVLGLSRLCPGTKPTPVRDVVLHRALGEMGPDAKSRAAALSKALRAASASASAAQGLGEPDRVTHGEEEEEVHFARLGTALSEVAEGGEEEEVESELATDDELNSATKIGSGPKWSAEHGPLLSGSLNKYLKWEGIFGGHPGDGRLDGRLGRRGLLGACVMGLDQLPAAADVIRLQQAPLPQAYRDSVVPTAQALKEALEAEESVGDAFIGEEAEKTLSALEQKAGQLVQRTPDYPRRNLWFLQ